MTNGSGIYEAMKSEAQELAEDTHRLGKNRALAKRIGQGREVAGSIEEITRAIANVKKYGVKSSPCLTLPTAPLSHPIALA